MVCSRNNGFTWTTETLQNSVNIGKAKPLQDFFYRAYRFSFKNVHNPKSMVNSREL
jgi:hypothetical protein